MPEKADFLPGPRQRQAIGRRLAAAAARMNTAAINEMTARYPWFTELDADNRASITLVVRAGIDGFVAWFSGADTEEPQNIFAAAPRSLTRALTLHQTVDLIRATIETVEQQITELPRGDRPVLATAILHYSREIAFEAAEVYARAAETRGAWDARLEALVMDAVVRLLPGALGHEASAADESFSGGLLEYPQYTRPRDFRGMQVPDVLISGDHGKVAAWRQEQARRRTQECRPDLLEGQDGDG